MKFHDIIYMCVATLLCFQSCASDREEGFADTPDNQIPFEVEIKTRAGEGIDEIEDSPLFDYFIDGRSVILISQRGEHISLDFNNMTPSTTDPSILEPNTNLYKYVYYTNPSANWQEGFNFEPYGDRALDWDLMRANTLNGAYALGALYYPVDFQVENAVETDQSTYDNLLRSNILAAYHITNTYHDRIRFQFNHLMTAIHITLLIPEWNPEDNTGFGEDSAREAEMLKVKKDFNILWNFGSSEEPPSVALTDNPETYDIKMYLESVSNEVEEIDLSSISPYFNEYGVERVRKASFCILIPPQQPKEEGGAMRFKLTTMGGTEKSYLWYREDISDETSLNMARGMLGNFVLFLPRFANNAVLVRSNIWPWTEADSEFTVIPEDQM